MSTFHPDHAHTNPPKQQSNHLTNDLVDPGLSPVLLTRARLLAAEHAKLSGRLADSFDAKIAKRAGELAPSTAILKEWDNANEVSSPQSLISYIYLIN